MDEQTAKDLDKRIKEVEKKLKLAQSVPTVPKYDLSPA